MPQKGHSLQAHPGRIFPVSATIFVGPGPPPFFLFPFGLPRFLMGE